MRYEYRGLIGINGPMIIIEGAQDIGYEEICEIKIDNGDKKLGRVVEISGNKAVIQVFEGTTGLSLDNTRTRFVGKPMEFGLSKEILG